MSYATLMVYVDVEGKLDGRVSVAADLARRFDAHLIGIASGAPISVVLGEDAEAVAETPQLRDLAALLGEKAQQFRAAVGSSSRRVEWRSVVGLQADVVAREARAADLVIIGNARASRDPFRALDPGSFILKAGRPVLVVPTGVRALPPRRVAVAWKDVREARRAVQDALPFLREAENVVIVEVSERGADQASSRLRDVANYLARHGVATVTERVLPVDATAADSLLRFIADENISLVAAGATATRGWGNGRMVGLPATCWRKVRSVACFRIDGGEGSKK
jgi:nucleotide-binding universal stress UspA family protein